jgi:methionyl-tRNA formyltransferase
MRIFFFGNNSLGHQVLAWLRQRREQIVGLALHPAARRSHGDRILDAAGLAPEHVFDASTLDTPEVVESIGRLRPDIGVSVLFGYILRRSLLDQFPLGCLNLHPSLLPYNRGSYPNVWSIIEKTPAGATLHYVDEGIDTGDVVAQKGIQVEPTDTGESLYRKLEATAFSLFQEKWPDVLAGRVQRSPQPTNHGTIHRVRDVDELDYIDQDRDYNARALIDILRARTFPPHPGAYTVIDGRKVYLRLSLDYAEN